MKIWLSKHINYDIHTSWRFCITMFKCRPIFFECVHKVLIFLYVCVPLYTCTVHTICFTERSSQTYPIKLSFKKGGKIYHFLNTLTCSLEEVIRIKYKKRPFSKVKLIKQDTSSFKKNMSKICLKKKKEVN